VEGGGNTMSAYFKVDPKDIYGVFREQVLSLGNGGPLFIFTRDNEYEIPKSQNTLGAALQEVDYSGDWVLGRTRGKNGSQLEVILAVIDKQLALEKPTSSVLKGFKKSEKYI
jgi:hypothetical protein